jgi:hypothetical protein
MRTRHQLDGVALAAVLVVGGLGPLLSGEIGVGAGLLVAGVTFRLTRGKRREVLERLRDQPQAVPVPAQFYIFFGGVTVIGVAGVVIAIFGETRRPGGVAVIGAFAAVGGAYMVIAALKSRR